MLIKGSTFNALCAKRLNLTVLFVLKVHFTWQISVDFNDHAKLTMNMMKNLKFGNSVQKLTPHHTASTDGRRAFHSTGLAIRWGDFSTHFPLKQVAKSGVCFSGRLPGIGRVSMLASGTHIRSSTPTQNAFFSGQNPSI